MSDLPDLSMFDMTQTKKEYRKTATIFATQIDHPFMVTTLEGDHRGKAGDWLVHSSQPPYERWIVDDDIFRNTYVEVEDCPGLSDGKDWTHG